jgi:hypothetical protein
MGSLLKKEIPPSLTDSTITTTTTTTTKDAGKQMLSGWGKRMSILGSSSLEIAKKIGNSVDEKVGNLMANNDNVKSQLNNNNKLNSNNSYNNTFVIDDEDEDDGMGPRDSSTKKTTLSKTDYERNQALIMHKMAGIQKGNKLVICRENFPGALLFPAIKYKEVKQSLIESTDINNEDIINNNNKDNNNKDNNSEISTDQVDVIDTKTISLAEPIQVHIYLSI